MRRPLALLLSFCAFVLVSCGETDVIDPPIVVPPPPPGESVEVSMILFAAPSCGPCKVELPEMQRLYDERLASKKGRLFVEVVVPTGETMTKNPTQEMAVAYGKALGLSFPMRADEAGAKFPKWTNYRKYFPEGTALPTAAVLDKEGKVLKTFVAPAPVEVIEFVEAQLK